MPACFKSQLLIPAYGMSLKVPQRVPLNLISKKLRSKVGRITGMTSYDTGDFNDILVAVVNIETCTHHRIQTVCFFSPLKPIWDLNIRFPHNLWPQFP